MVRKNPTYAFIKILKQGDWVEIRASWKFKKDATRKLGMYITSSGKITIREQYKTMHSFDVQPYSWIYRDGTTITIVLSQQPDDEPPKPVPLLPGGLRRRRRS